MLTRRLHLSLRWVVLGLGVLCAASAIAQGEEYTGMVALRHDFPPASIHSVARATQAKNQLAAIKPSLEREYAARQQACYQHFFATRCIDQATERYRQANAEIQRIEREVRIFDRQQQILERDRRVNARRAAEAEKLLQRQRATNTQTQRIVTHQREQENKNIEQQAESAQERRVRVQQRIDERAAHEREKVAERAEHERQYAQKLKAAEAKIAERERRRAEKNQPVALPE